MNLSHNILEINDLKKSLTFLHIPELRDILENLVLPTDGKKIALIYRIVHFLETGKILHSPKIPEVSKARKGIDYPLEPTTLILKNAYKNDLVTRLFFKKLIGEYFHFTAFGIDWINEKWLAANPPTYQEFADMWKVEYARRKANPKAPKEEWAYINFAQKYSKEYKNASHREIIQAWNQERARNVEIVQRILTPILNPL